MNRGESEYLDLLKKTAAENEFLANYYSRVLGGKGDEYFWDIYEKDDFSKPDIAFYENVVKKQDDLLAELADRIDAGDAMIMETPGNFRDRYPGWSYKAEDGTEVSGDAFPDLKNRGPGELNELVLGDMGDRYNGIPEGLSHLFDERKKHFPDFEAGGDLESQQAIDMLVQRERERRRDGYQDLAMAEMDYKRDPESRYGEVYDLPSEDDDDPDEEAWSDSVAKESNGGENPVNMRSYRGTTGMSVDSIPESPFPDSRNELQSEYLMSLRERLRKNRGSGGEYLETDNPEIMRRGF